MDSQLKHGILPFCILKILKKQDQYGYDIVKIIQQYIPDTEESTIYAILRRLNKDQLTETYSGSVSNGPVRKYYKISKLGEEQLKEYIDSWRVLTNFFKELDT